MRSQETNRSTASKYKDKPGIRRDVLLWTMIAAVTTVVVGSEQQMVVADERKFPPIKCFNGDRKVMKMRISKLVALHRPHFNVKNGVLHPRNSAHVLRKPDFMRSISTPRIFLLLSEKDYVRVAYAKALTNWV
jgi:hypothetical protein